MATTERPPNINPETLRIISLHQENGAVRARCAEQSGECRIVEMTVPALQFTANCISGRPVFPYAGVAPKGHREAVTTPQPQMLELTGHQESGFDLAMIWREKGGTRALQTMMPQAELARWLLANSEPVLLAQQKAA